jgi:hypothetical protein
VKDENIYIKNYASAMALRDELRDYFLQYNYGRAHESLAYKRPAEVHFDLVEGGELLLINHLNFVDS